MPPTITKPPGPDIPRDFTLNAALSKAWKATVKAADGTETEELYLSGVASSTVRDRQGDTITAQCQAMMLEQLQAGIGRDGHPLTMFLNHSYKVPEDVLGACNESRLTASAPSDGDEAVIDLEIVCRVAQDNERAVKSWKIVNSGISLGYSIGGSLTEYEVDDENDDGESWCPPLIINGMALYEISLCGIPANPRSYTETLKSMEPAARASALAEAQKFLRSMGLEDEAPEPSTNWPRDMRRGLVRRATRSEAVREALRKELSPASKELGDSDSEAPLPRHAQSAVAASIGCLTDAMGHGMCADSLSNVQTAHKSLTDLLAPSGEEDGEENADASVDNAASTESTEAKAADAELAAQVELVRALPEAQRSALLDAAKTLAADPSLVLLTGAPGLDDELAQRRAEAEALAAKAKQFADDATAAEVRKASLTTEIANLEQKLAELRDTPIGRATSSGAAGSSSAPYVQKTVQELRAELSAAVSGAGPADHLARRPA